MDLTRGGPTILLGGGPLSLMLLRTVRMGALLGTGGSRGPYRGGCLLVVLGALLSLHTPVSGLLCGSPLAYQTCGGPASLGRGPPLGLLPKPSFERRGPPEVPIRGPYGFTGKQGLLGAPLQAKGRPGGGGGVGPKKKNPQQQQQKQQEQKKLQPGGFGKHKQAKKKTDKAAESPGSHRGSLARRGPRRGAAQKGGEGIGIEGADLTARDLPYGLVSQGPAS